MNAKEAKEISNSFYDKIALGYYHHIIEQVASSGKFNLKLYEAISDAEMVALRLQGYKVEVVNVIGHGLTVQISWD